MDDVRADGAMAALGAAVPPPEVQWNGKAWKIGHPTQGAKALLERLVLQTAEANLDAAKGVLSEKRFAAEEKRFGDALMGRTWATFGELWLATMNGPAAFPLFLASLVQQHHPEFAPELARQMWLERNTACRTALVQVLPDFFGVLSADMPADEEQKRAFAATFAAGVMAALLSTPTG